MNNPLLNMALNMITKNSSIIQNNPMSQSYIDVLKSGDSRKGEEIAANLCQTYGVTKEQAISQARQFFHI